MDSCTNMIGCFYLMKRVCIKPTSVYIYRTISMQLLSFRYRQDIKMHSYTILLVAVCFVVLEVTSSPDTLCLSKNEAVSIL